MRTRTRLLIQWVLLASVQSIGTGCGGSESVRFANSDAASDGTMGSGGSGTGGGGGTAGSSGAMGTGGAGTTGTGGTGGAAGTSGSSGSGGGAGKSGASGSGGAAGSPGTSGSGGGAGKSGASGSGGAAGSSGASGGGVAGSSGASGSGGVAGSSGASGSGGAAGRSGGSGASGASGKAGSAGSAGTGVDAGTDGDADSVDVRADRDVVISDAGCPNVLGRYQINNADGFCGDLNENAPQEIRGTGCTLHFISVVDGGIGAINGEATLGPNGIFSGAMLVEGTAMRSSCSGSWNANQVEMTVTCGSGANECSVEMVRIGP